MSDIKDGECVHGDAFVSCPTCNKSNILQNTPEIYSNTDYEKARYEGEVYASTKGDKTISVYLHNERAKSFAAGYAAGRAEALAEVMPVLEFYSDKNNWEPLLVWNHTTCSLEPTGKALDEGVEPDQGKRARELLERIKSEKA